MVMIKIFKLFYQRVTCKLQKMCYNMSTASTCKKQECKHGCFGRNWYVKSIMNILKISPFVSFMSSPLLLCLPCLWDLLDCLKAPGLWVCCVSAAMLAGKRNGRSDCCDTFRSTYLVSKLPNRWHIRLESLWMWELAVLHALIKRTSPDILTDILIGTYFKKK